MGSEGPPAVTIHVTGFKKFHGVSENPTETIVCNLKEYMKKKGLPKRLNLGSCSILETAGQGGIVPLYQTLQSAISNKDSETSNSGIVIWVHFGVNSGATRFAIEQQAVNEATFRCADELGWKPQKVPVVPADGGISRTRVTSLPVDEITKALAKKGYEVMASDDAGRFVCNYVYYHSLRFAEQNGINSLFVHVPLFLTVDEDTQMQFTASLFEHLSESSCGNCSGVPSSKQKTGGIVIALESPYAFQQNVSATVCPIAGRSSTSENVMFVQGTASLQARLIGGLRTS